MISDKMIVIFFIVMFILLGLAIKKVFNNPIWSKNIKHFTKTNLLLISAFVVSAILGSTLDKADIFYFLAIVFAGIICYKLKKSSPAPK
ncbi:hypothetical protein ACFL38_02840 [Candidatus Omnitrophota bacterium]